MLEYLVATKVLQNKSQRKIDSVGPGNVAVNVCKPLKVLLWYDLSLTTSSFCATLIQI